MTGRPDPKVRGPDGVERPLSEQKRLDSIIAGVLGSPAGQEVMAYLKSITLNRVLGPDATDAQLRHVEGGRFIVYVLDKRIQRGREQK